MNKKIILLGTLLLLVSCLYVPYGWSMSYQYRPKLYGWLFIGALDDFVIKWDILILEWVAIILGTLGFAYVFNKKDLIDKSIKDKIKQRLSFITKYSLNLLNKKDFLLNLLFIIIGILIIGIYVF